MVIVITGPTAVGKTKLSIALASSYHGEIINADSTQIFKHLNIATAKVTKEEMGKIPHHLLDIKELDENYTVYDYQIDARKKIEEIEKKGKIPILVGGTGLYIKAALYDYRFEEEKEMSDEYDTFSTEELYQRLLSIYPQTKIHPHNRKRIVRSLNYYKIHHKILEEEKKTDHLLYDAIFIGLTTDRKTLYEHINKRVDQMIEQGLVEEAKKIYDLSIRSKAVMTPIGYKELFPYFEHKKSLEECIDDIKKKSRHYAKRQYTWFFNQMNITWFETNYTDFTQTIRNVEKYIKREEKARKN